VLLLAILRVFQPRALRCAALGEELPDKRQSAIHVNEVDVDPAKIDLAIFLLHCPAARHLAEAVLFKRHHERILIPLAPIQGQDAGVEVGIDE
jgi:hypothetical protein